MVWNLFLSKVILVWGKARSRRAPNLDCRGAESPGWSDVLPKNSAWDVMHERAHCSPLWSWWSCQSPVAHSCSLLNHPNSFHIGMFRLNTKFDVDLLLYSLSHFECDNHTVHMLTRQCLPPPLTSTVKSSLLTRAFQSTLLGCPVNQCRPNHPGYINNGCTFSGQTSYHFYFLFFKSQHLHKLK